MSEARFQGAEDWSRYEQDVLLNDVDNLEK